jgi:hypothetical protein
MPETTSWQSSISSQSDEEKMLWNSLMCIPTPTQCVLMMHTCSTLEHSSLPPPHLWKHLTCRIEYIWKTHPLILKRIIYIFTSPRWTFTKHYIV